MPPDDDAGARVAGRGAMTRSRTAKRDRGARGNDDDDARRDVEGHADDDDDDADDDAAGGRAADARDGCGRRIYKGASSPGGSAQARPSSVAYTSGNPATEGLGKRRRRDPPRVGVRRRDDDDDDVYDVVECDDINDV